MAELFASGRIVDGILGLMLLEAATLMWVRHRTRRGFSALQIAANLGAGAALLLALRAAIVGRAWPAIAGWLVVALGAHALEVSLRWVADTRGQPGAT